MAEYFLIFLGVAIGPVTLIQNGGSLVECWQVWQATDFSLSSTLNRLTPLPWQKQELTPVRFRWEATSG
jgi:hypothetical protein